MTERKDARETPDPLPEPQGLEEALNLAFDGAGRERSILARIEQASGTRSRVLLRDAPEEDSPVIRVRRDESGDIAQDDARYEILGEVARGGVGIIFKGRDKDLGRTVALKVLRPEHLANPGVVARFVEEAQIGGQLQHPGIVPVHELRMQPDGRPYFAMKLVKGRTLAALLAQRHDPGQDLGQLLQVFERVCQTIAYAHARGVIHRDLKPANVMLGPFGEVQVVDWGFAKVLEQGGLVDEQRASDIHAERSIIETVRSQAKGSASIGGSLMGTPAYMPPEQAAGRVDALDERSDVFALGAMLCEILTGLPPYTGSREQVLHKALHAESTEAFERLDASRAPADLVEVAKRCLAPRRAARPQDAGAVAKALAAYQLAREERARTASLHAAEARGRAAEAEETARQERRARHLTLALAASVVVVIGVVATVWHLSARSGERRLRRASQTVARAIEEATLLRGEARAAGEQDLSRWPAAVQAADRAVAIAAASEADEETQRRALAFRDETHADHAAARERVAQVQADRNFTNRLLDLRARRGPEFDAAETEAAFTAALADRGIDVAKGDVEQVAAQIRERATAAVMIAALDDWVALRRRLHPEDAGGTRRLLEILRRADPDPWCATVRERLAFGDLAGLRDLAAQETLEQYSVARLHLLGDALGRAGAPDEAVRVLRLAQRKDAYGWWSNLALGWWLTQAEPPAWDEAIGHLRAAAADRPNLVNTPWLLGTALEAKGDLEGAIAVWKGIADAEDRPQALPQRLGAALFSKAEALIQSAPGSAESMLGEVLRLTPDHVEARHAQSRLLVRAGRLPEAAEALGALLELEPDHRTAWIELGSVREQQGNLREAASAYGEAARRWPWDRAAVEAAGRAQRKLGDAEAAVALYAAAATALRDGAWPATARTQLTNAESRDIDAILNGPQITRYMAYMGWAAALAYAGRPEKALDACGPAVQLAAEVRSTPFNLRMAGDKVHLVRAILLRRLGRSDEARAAFRQAVEARSQAPNTTGILMQTLGWPDLTEPQAFWRGVWLACWPDPEAGDLEAAGAAVRALEDWAARLSKTDLGLDKLPPAETEDAGSKPGPWVKDGGRLAITIGQVRDLVLALVQRTVGIYRYHAGDLQGAVEALDRERDLVTGVEDAFVSFGLADADDATGRLHLAMALQRLGRTAEARKAYEEVLRLYDEERPQDPATMFYLEQARAVLEADGGR